MADSLQEALEALNEATALDSTYAALVINNDLRTITVPPNFIFGVYNDKNVLSIDFEMPRYYDDIDLSTFSIQINYLAASNVGNIYEVENPVVEEDRIAFEWLLDRGVFLKAGDVTFIVCLRLTGEGGTVIQEFNTTVAKGKVLEGLEVEDPEDPEAYSIIAHLREIDTRVTAQARQVATDCAAIGSIAAEAQEALDEANAGVAEIKEKYGSPLVAPTAAGMIDHTKIYVYTGSETGYTFGNWYYWDGTAWTSGGVYNSAGVNTDSTLSVSGMPADAKKTGDEISGLKEDLTNVATEFGNNMEYVVGAKNLLTGVSFTETELSTSGVETSSITQLTSSSMPVTPGDYSFIYSKANSTGHLRIHGYANGVWQSVIKDYTTATTGQKTVTVTIPSNIDAIRICYWKANIQLFALFAGQQIAESKLDKYQGTDNINKVMTVGQDGNLIPQKIAPATIFTEANPSWGWGKLSPANGTITSYKSGVLSTPVLVKAGDYITVDNDLYIMACLYNSSNTGTSTFVKSYSWTNSGQIIIDADGYLRVNVSDASHYNVYDSTLSNMDYQYDVTIHVQETAFEQIAAVNETLTEQRTITNKTSLFQAQQAIAADWHLPFINLYDQMGLGNNHLIPGTATTWSESGTTDLSQKDVWMSDGTHPYRGEGLVDMYGRTIANQLALVSPSYHDGSGLDTPSYWAGKRMLWMGTSIPAGSDPDAGSGTGATYPQLVATQLGATSVNIAKGSSMLRVKSSTGLYQGIPFSHYARAVTRMIAECDAIAADWANIYPNVPNAPSTLSAENLTVMKQHSFENLLVPYLDGTNTAPDLYVIDYGHNDTANGTDGHRDFWVEPTLENIENGVLANDDYMTDNNYANLKLAFNNDLSGIPDLPALAASVNRNCYQGATNFLITLILTYKPYARIVIVSDYN